MSPKPKITLTKEQETLLIPLYAKAQNNPLFFDNMARQILDGVDYDFHKLRVPEKTAVTVRIRAKQLDHYVRQFLEIHPEAVILHPGCGLDSRCQRVAHPSALWFDLDFPDVISLRRKFFTESDNYRMIASSVTDLGWMDYVPLDDERPVLVIAEGLLMYLSESDVKALILGLHTRFPGCELIFDAFSSYTVEQIKTHPSIRRTGAVVHWGIDDPHEIETWSHGIRFVEEWFFSQSPDIQRLSWFYRLMFRLTASMQVAQKAHRLLYYRL